MTFEPVPQCDAGDAPVLRPVLRANTDDARDQDDMCVWVDAKRPARSTIIASDKSAGAVFVYDVEGKLLQRLDVTKPGNIDLRHNVTFGNELLDLVVVNQRAGGFRLLAFRVDRETRRLEAIPGEPLLTGPNYGGCLYHSPTSGRVYFFCTAEAGVVEQHELTADANGRASNRKVRSITLGKCEGAVADDENRCVFIAEEAKGVWKLGAEPDAGDEKTLVVRVGENGVKGDIEGLALAREPRGGGLLLVSDQGRDRFLALERRAPHAFVGEFGIEGAAETDGIDVVPGDFGGLFAGGLFLCHTDRAPRPILATPWREIEAALRRTKAGNESR